MGEKPEVITLCGSTRFKEEYIQMQKDLTLDGAIVISVGLFSHRENPPVTSEQKRMLDKLHFRKIDISDSIYVINVGGYIGESTANEIKYARLHGKRIRYLEKVNRP